LTTVDYTANGADFLIIGSWGNQQDFSDMVNVATEMNTWASNNHSKFVLSVGSNFFLGGSYSYEGVLSPTDDKFTTLWKNVYGSGASPALTALAPLPWWPVMGRHDWYTAGVPAGSPPGTTPDGTLPGSPIFEMEHQDPNWNLPDYFHVQRFALPNSKHATLIYIDTQLLDLGYAGKKDMKYNFMYAGWSAAENTHLKQLAWIDKALETANEDDYVLVMATTGVFSCGSDVAGSFDMEYHPPKPPALPDPHDPGVLGLIRKWKPTAYISGIHHTLAWFLDGSTLHIQSGAGGNVDAACAPLVPTAPGGEFPNTYGFAHAKLTGSEFSVDFVTETGAVVLNMPSGASIGPRTPVTGVTADTTYLPPPGDPSITFHHQ
jgi:hypothetical protein